MFDEGLAAYTCGDYATALKEWRLLAEQGHAKAQYSLGYMYDTFLKYTSSGASLNDSYKKDHSRW